jgi:hypothetical protein
VGNVNLMKNSYWDDTNNIRQFLNWMAADLKLASMDDWLRVDGETLKRYDVVVWFFELFYIALINYLN